MEVIKRDGRKENVSFDKITTRISHLTHGLNTKYVNPTKIAQETINGLYDGISTVQLDQLSADICASKIQQHPDFGKLASRILVSNLHKSTEKDYFEVVRNLFHHGIVSESFFSFVFKYSKQLQEMFDYHRDYSFDFFGFKTLERSYLHSTKIGNEKIIIERPQHLWMRVAIQIHGLRKIDQIDELESFKVLQKIKTTYDYMSLGYFTHATPTLFNAGSNRPQLSSCFLASMDDNIENIFKTIGDLGQISKWSGGIGVHLSSIRAKGSLIKGTNGHSDGIIPLCKVLEATARFINQAGRRNGSIAVYMEPWHADIQDFVDLRKNTGDENLRARDLFLALWVPDLFMKRVQNDEMWSLMSSNVCPGLNDSYGEEFERLYTKYESEGKYVKQIRATELWRQILENQIETGMPYINFKDHVNNKSNQKNLGVIKSSNLCSEIVEYSDKDQTAVCNLASICLPKFVEDGQFNFTKLGEIAEITTENLNNVIDVNYYPIPEAKHSNMLNRPIGLGVQGLADVYCLLKLSFESEEAKILNKKIFETIYYHSLKKSVELAKQDGPYSSFRDYGKDSKDSPFSQGIVQWMMWGLKEQDLLMGFNWTSLISDLKKYGARNSLLTALMPTASTSQIMGNCECFEPYSSNLFVRKTLAGEYTIVNEHLVKDLIDLGLWNKEMFEEILYFNGSIQKIKDIPQNIKDIYKTAFELKGKDIVQQSIERGPFIDQTQSMNIFQAIPDFNKLSASHFYGWKNGLKTGMYYLRTQPVVDPIKFGLDPSSVQRIKNKYNDKEEMNVCKWRPGMKRPEGCDVCSA
jgi:ribonucleoside-diphosphate reductase alpha subunit